MWLTKYNASGNDFLISIGFIKKNRSKLAKKLCNRFSGIGADGFVVLLPNKKFAYEWEFYNSDGSNANMCGNASRCVAHYAYNNKLASKNHTFLSGAGEIKANVSNDMVEINLGRVAILKENIIEDNLNFSLLDSGVPHLVSFVKSKNNFNDYEINFLRKLRLKYNANVNLACILDRENISLLTYERGVENITLACGTGMGAVYFLARYNNKINNNAVLTPPSNEKLYLRKIENEVYFKGKVQKIAEIFI
ncbi:diaminopimelate epimerase [Helicobacter sp. MIT 14-3879]|uniref:diaminopimelate epimerase n=1 Tax=Helicobacter sp. MIT 14-3879 TaxID=2040649 RepID=UPI000E1EB581|nr:diaminopimelate epimerase [Helicobacter sp. MIT 14-3879]RDU62445.1 diaminopimelate epimerase [Helicobacter sp. MIT 14-3879]